MKKDRILSEKHTKALKNAQTEWLKERSKYWNICAALHVPNAMRKHYFGYDEHWLAKELTRYFNKVDRHIYKAAHKNRGMRLQRIITLEYSENVGWHAHGIFDCAEGYNEDETIEILKRYWQKQTERFAIQKFEQRLDYFEYDRGNYIDYILKNVRLNEEGAVGILDTKNTFLLNI